MFYFLLHFRGSFLIRYSWNRRGNRMKTLPCFVRISSGNKGNRLPRPHHPANPHPHYHSNVFKIFTCFPKFYMFWYFWLAPKSKFPSHSIHWVSKSQFLEVFPIDFHLMTLYPVFIILSIFMIISNFYNYTFIQFLRLYPILKSFPDRILWLYPMPPLPSSQITLSTNNQKSFSSTLLISNSISSSENKKAFAGLTVH